ncbi:MAG TPA: CapA family protein, partial [Candidatus Doudnabacteria bacterium]|nr:CapA family protein [Candidatus Doudnabacteria bacterium]
MYLQFTVIIYLALAVLVSTFGSPFVKSSTSSLYGGLGGDSLEEYYDFGKRQTRLDQMETEVSFHAVGDIMLSRNVAGQIAKNQKDSYWPFRELEDELGWEVDFNFGNLESPFTGRDDYNPSGSLVFNAPTWAFYGLDQYNFKVLNLANNHALDQGLQGLLYTRDLLRQHDMVPIGVGENLEEAWRGGIYSVKGIRVGFIGASYTSLNDGGKARNNYVARMEDTERLVESINELKTRSDFIVVTMHAGAEYVRNP